MEFGIIGTSIWQQNVPLLERLTIDRSETHETLARLKAELGLDELIYLSTCNRVEFIYVTSGRINGPKVLHRLIDFFFRGQSDLSFFPNDFYQLSGKDAVTHLFRTVSSLESLVVGETQITGQFKQVYQEGVERGFVGPVLESLASEALLVAKRVKRETSIGEGAVSMASLAAEELCVRIGERTEPTIALVGSGPMTAKMACYLKENLPSARLLFVNRTVEKMASLAQEFSGVTISLDSFLTAPNSVDAIVSATASSQALFDRAFLDRLPTKGRVVCVDLAVPRDFTTDFNHDPRAILIDMPSLKARGQGNLRQKFVEASKANGIVRESVNKYLADRIEGTLKPIFHDSYRASIELAHSALNDLFARRVTSLGSEDKEAVLRLVTKLIGHSSYQPVRLLSDHLAAMRSELSLEDLRFVRREAV